MMPLAKPRLNGLQSYSPALLIIEATGEAWARRADDESVPDAERELYRVAAAQVLQTVRFERAKARRRAG